MLILSFILMAALVALDQLLKLWIVGAFPMSAGAIRSYINVGIGDFGIFSITHIRNNGAGWSILGGKTVFLIALTSVILVAIIIYLVIKRRTIGKTELLALSFIAAGGFGNLIDRFRMLIEGTDAFPGVIDYIKLDFIDFPVFNFADCCVTVGAILFCVAVIVEEIKSSKLKKAAAQNKKSPENTNGEV